MNHMADKGLPEGKMIALKAGDLVAADLRLLDAEALEVDEFELTGEIRPVCKHIDPKDDVIVYHGSRVLRGRGIGIVVAVGEKTEYGNIIRQSIQHQPNEAFPPFEGKRIVLPLLLLLALAIRAKWEADPISLIMPYGGSALLLLLLQNMNWFQFVWLRRQRAKLRINKILLRDCHALQDIKDVDLICFDKTGVLTSRDIKVKRIFLGGEWAEGATIQDAETQKLVITGCALCNDAATPDRLLNISALDRALMSYADEHGLKSADALNRHPKIYEKPFHSEERYMAVGFKGHRRGGAFYFAKGDPEVILKLCAAYVTPFGEIKPLNFNFLTEVRAAIEKMANDGNIVIALAYGEGSSPPSRYRLLCLFQLENPLRPQANEILCALEAKRIRNIMLTGDRVETSLAVAQKTGIENAPRGLYLTGKDLLKMELTEIIRQCAYISVFPRMLPSQKGIIVNAFRQRGHRVAMVGDGANDVIAMRAADIGITFFEQSSPLARRTARILVHELSDILRIFEAAHALKMEIKFLTGLIASLLSILLLIGPFFDLIDLITQAMGIAGLSK